MFISNFLSLNYIDLIAFLNIMYYNLHINPLNFFILDVYKHIQVIKVFEYHFYFF